jgi:uncharacterized protein YbcI
MKFSSEIIEKYLDENPHQAHAKFQHLMIATLTGVDPETSKFICNAQRVFRMVLKKRGIKNEYQHEKQHEYLESLGYNSEAIHNFDKGVLL